MNQVIIRRIEKIVNWIIQNKMGTASVDELTRNLVSCQHSFGFHVISMLDVDEEKLQIEKVYSRAVQALSLLKHGERVVFMCQAGISRSNGLAALLIAYTNNLTWEEGLEEVKKKVRRTHVLGNMIDTCKEVLRKLKYARTCSCGSEMDDNDDSCFYCTYLA